MTTGNILSGGGDAPARPAGSRSGESGAGSHAGRLRVAPDPERDLVCARLPLTDLGNAERWRVRHGADFRFCAELGWLAWDGRRWKLLSEEKDRLPAEVMQSVFATVRAVRNEAALVAAAGGLEAHPVSDAVFPVLLQWAREVQNEGRDSYLKRDEDGERERWLDELDLADFVIDFSKRKAWSGTIAAWAKSSEGVGKLNAVAQLAKSFADVAIRHDELDAEPMAINVLNGTLRFRRLPEKRSSAEIEAGKSEWHTGGWAVKKTPHRREDLITKLAPVKYAPSAACPEYDGFVLAVQPEPTMRRFLHQWGGYSLTGDTGEQKLAFFYGQGRNGKGTWVETVAAIAGDYAGSVPIESFLDTGGKRRGDQATPDIARLPGVRLLRVSEPEKGSALNEGLVKQVTGGDPVDARHLNKGFFTFVPDFKMTISGNHKPKVKDTSDGIWRRMQLVPWDVRIADDAVDRKLGERLRANEASGILNRLLAGLLDWLQHGLIEPELVRLATRAYRDDSDDIGRFLSALCVVSADTARVRVPAAELHQFYQAWAETSGGATLHIKAFRNAMLDKGFESKTADGVKWLGVALREGLSLDAVKRGEWDDAGAFGSGPEQGAERSGGGSGVRTEGDDDVDPFDPAALDWPE